MSAGPKGWPPRSGGGAAPECDHARMRERYERGLLQVRAASLTRVSPVGEVHDSQSKAFLGSIDQALSIDCRATLQSLEWVGCAGPVKERFLTRGAPFPIIVTQVAALVCALILMSWPALFNGAAFFFPDTQTYLRGAGTAIFELTGWETDWSDRHRMIKPVAGNVQNLGSSVAVSAADGTKELAHPVLLGRSVYYGLMIFPFVVLLGSLGGVLVHAALAVLVLWITMRALGLGQGRQLAVRVLVAAGILATFTSLPFFVSLLMPDIFTGFAIAMALSALVGWRRLTTFEKAALVLIACMAAMSHSSNILILSAMLVLGSVVWLCFRGVQTASLIVLAAAATTGVVSERIFVEAVVARLGEPPIRPPFLTARLVHEGPAFWLLRERCPQIRFEACRFLARMPQDSDTFLWSLEPTRGVFSVESHAVQRRLAEQDSRLAWNTFQTYPVEVIQHSAAASVRQLFMAKADIFNLPPAIDELPHRYGQELSRSRSAAGQMPMRLFNISIYFTSFISVIILLVLLAKSRNREFRVAALLLLGAVAANAFITGALSKPHNRYNARLLWVLPLAAGAILASSRCISDGRGRIEKT
jgi:hypothetical protein